MNKLFILFLCLSFFNNVISLQLNVTFRDQYGPTQPDYINTLVSSGDIHTCSNGDKLIKVSFDETKRVCAYSLANGTTEGVSGNSCLEYNCSSIPNAIQEPGVGCSVKSYSIDHESDVAGHTQKSIDPNVDSAQQHIGFSTDQILYSTNPSDNPIYSTNYLPKSIFDEKQGILTNAKNDCEKFQHGYNLYKKYCYDYEIDSVRQYNTML
jgi:hypothetical protein